jgi:hypothetical protein
MCHCYDTGMKNDRKFTCVDVAPALLDPKDFPVEKLFYWLAMPRQPVLASDNPIAKMFIAAMLNGEAVKFIYIGGSTPGAARSINVSLVFQNDPEGRVYVAGYCKERSANRVFALDLIMSIHAWN